MAPVWQDGIHEPLREINMSIWREFAREFWAAAAQGPRLFIAPLVGAFRQVRTEWRRAERELSAKSL